MNTARVALLHISIVPGAIERNRYVLEETVKYAAASGAQWIITPELAVCGLQFARIIGIDWIQPQPDAWMRRFCQLVRSLKRSVFLACPERDAGRLYNSVFVINPRGEIIGKHRKINVRSDSLSWSSPGEDLVPLQCDGVKVGLLVCADAFTPGIAGTLKSQGAQILLSPSSWGPGIHGPNGEWEARTRETGLPLIVCNRTGAEKTLEFWKAPSIVVKNGRRVLSHTSEQSAVLLFDWNFTAMTPLSTVYRAEYLKE
ncbi:MAG TPA: carbon-nitrogen hydrolase family protein [Nitrospiraceae bacterium]|jgi:N-carbamoylputrescine amidase|nr:carbon-nitrogen hydrolase family protein [Nitrospiraceae bacterium]